MELMTLTAAMDELVGIDPARLADPDTIVDLHRQHARLEAVLARAAVAFDTSGNWQADGARSAATWLSVRCHLPKTAAKTEQARGRSLRHLPACEKAWLAGDINSAHVRVLAAARTPNTAAQLDADEAMLVEHAKTLRYHHFVAAVAYWLQHADPDGADQAAGDQRQARRVHLSQSFNGLWFGDLILDPVSGAIVHDELERIDQELFQADWAAAQDRLGRTPRADELGRSPEQRRADALVEMAIRSGTAPADGRRPAPLFTVLVDYQTLLGRMCQLANGSVIAPGALIPWLDTALIERVVFGGPSRVLDVGVAQRLFTGATRRAVEVRDRECYHPYCDTPAPQCQCDHVIPYQANGPTIQTNGRMACGFHNRNRQANRQAKRPPNPPPRRT